LIHFYKRPVAGEKYKLATDTTICFDNHAWKEKS